MFPFRSRCPRQDRPIVTKSAPRKHKARPTFRPHLKRLEDRLAPAVFEVVPLATTADGVTTFHSLFAALHKTAAFAPGDVIQIEPGSNPGTVLNADLQVPAVANITIQGDLAAAGSLANIPHFIIGNTYTPVAGQTGWTFKNVNIDLTDNIGAGASPSMELQGGGTITGSTITIGTNANTNAVPYVVFSAGATAAAVNTFTNNTIVLGTTSTAATTTLSLVNIQPGTSAGDKDIITGNSFQANAGTNFANFLLDYTTNSSVAGQTELIGNNTFTGAAGSDLTALAGIVGVSITGMTVQGNTFTDPDSTAAGVIGLKLDESGGAATSAQQATVTGNVFRLTGTKAVDIAVIGGTAGKTTTTDTINSNVLVTSLQANGGTGLKITAGATAGGAGTGDVVTVTAQGNNFNNDQFGVQVVTNANTSAANLIVDLGGGGVSSGANNFRGDPTGSANGGAVVVSGVNAASLTIIQAQNDIFTGTAAADVFVPAAITNVTINTGGALTGNTAFVQTVYLDVLGRPGSASELSSWTNSSLSQLQIASDINRSPEATSRLVNQLYLTLLQRSTAGDSGAAGWASLLQNGGTVENVIDGIVSSTEFANDNGGAGNNIAFVRALYHDLLGRQGSDAEVSGWLASIGTLGRAGVANGFVHSQEFRTDVVNELYQGPTNLPAATPLGSAAFTAFLGLLRRSAMPTAAEVASWVNSGLDLLTIENDIMASPEFFSNG